MDVDDAHPPIPSLDVNAHLFAPNPLLRRDNEDLVDENGDFCGRGRDLFVGPQAAPGDIHRFLTVASAEQFDGNASVDTALAKLGLTANFQNLPGMEICLMPHQTIGVAWMLEKENGPLKGGMLADEMGLGKTVQMMATIVMNRSDDPACKTTLILAPTALLDQWKLEIETKTSCDLQCYIYHGARKLKTKAELMKYDVVLTTFSTMALEWPDIDAEQKAKMKRTKKKKVADSFIESDSDDILSRKPKPKKKKDLGLLFQVNWYRIVLDEAQNIRTKKTRSSRAVTELKATYRWCLTGTPIINSLSDTYPLIRFLRIRPWYDWKDFNTQVAIIEKKNPGLATSRLQAIMATFVMRRKKDSMLDGKRLIDLPPKEVALVKLEFSAEERTIYNMVEGKAQAQFNRFLRAGTVLKNYVEVLVMLLRLRQTCAHAALIQENGMHMAFIDADDMAEDHRPAEVLTELSRAKETVSAEFVAKMRDKFMQSALLRMQAEKESLDAKPGDDEECPICFDAFTDPIVTPCTHMFCRECLTGVLNNPHALDAAGPHYNHDQRPCPVCRSAVSAVNVFSRPIFEPTDAELDDAMKTEDSDVDMQNVAATKRAPRIKSSDDVVDEEEEYSDDEDDEDDLSDFIVEDDEDEDYKDARRTAKRRVSTKRPVIIDSEDEMELEDQDIIFGAKRDDDISEEDPDKKRRFLPSTKMKAMMKSLETWAVENPGEKTIVISQWTECLKLASGYLVERNIPHVNYIGSMDRKKRDQAVKVFMHKDKARVMLMSLKCGGVGLNLTRANRVISLDLGWSEAIESQAHDRVHRLGQMRPVLVQRLVISNTVEDRILALQERKKNLADGSLGEGSGKKIGRLSVRELAACALYLLWLPFSPCSLPLQYSACRRRRPRSLQTYL
ncbi:hypothetical protein PLICRDRAFT_104830 [Plicaturopsis crispa FD-325 SS-3]|nr:hypothetical protein PLICRDRAFT_104830 [Plicaturopsis crispa FD-325 SS-3]